MKTRANPQWWAPEYDTAWERVSAAIQRDWDQTVHDFGGDEPDTDQDVDDTVAQAIGQQDIPPRGMPTYEESEPAVRYGYGARRHFGAEYADWDEDLEAELETEWREMHPDEESSWDRFKGAIRRGWEYFER